MPEMLQDGSIFARLSFVAMSRDPETGLYGLPICREGTTAPAQLHRSLFVQWLSLSLEQQVADMKIYLSGPDRNSDLAAGIWDAAESHRRLLPDPVMPQEEALFTSDLRLLGLLFKPEKVRSHDNGYRQVESSWDWRIRATLEQLRKQSRSRNLTLKILGSDLRVSARHLGRIFRNTTGLAFHRYLRALRLFKAADLLRTLTFSIKEISSAVGYTSTSNFSREFTEASGLSPMRYREHLIRIMPDSKARATTKKTCH